MSPSLPPRRFAPEPIEVTSKSSKPAQPAPETDTKPKPRRFDVQPVEMEQKSSRNTAAEDDKPKPRRFNVEPVESSSKSSREREEQREDKPKPRRFAPEPVATEHKSSKDKRDGEEKSGPRRFAPQLVEETSSSMGSKGHTVTEQPHVRFTPQPVETLYRTNRRPRDDADGSVPVQRAPRKFAPVVLDTAQRSRRAGNATPAITLHDKTESGHSLHAREHRRHIRGDRTPIEGEGEGGIPVTGMGRDGHLSAVDMLALRPDLRRQISPMDGSPSTRRLSMASQRSHSFRCPDLDTIESSESEPGSQTSSVSSSPGQDSPITASDSSFHDLYKHATRKRESVDENFQHYLLQLEAKKAQQRLEEQALAAFPNSDFHEPVQHYVDIEDESDEMEIEDRPVTWAGFEDDLLLSMAARRESTAKVSWEQLEMQRHAERLEQDRNAAKTTAKQPSQSPWWSDKPAGFGIGQPDKELESMQDRARPPMLGSDIIFPRCPSPEPARFDVTQGSTVLRNQMCYLTEHLEAGKRLDEEVGLWHAPDTENAHMAAARSKTSSPAKVSLNRGLWGGFCFDDGEHDSPITGLAVPTGPTGIMTPAVQHGENPFEQSFAVPGGAVDVGVGLKTPDTPPRSLRNGDMGLIDGMLSAEQGLDDLMEQEFPDSFITQVYNYLSLGYPSLARPFDEELSKISRVPIADLRQDDKKAKSLPRGYIRLGSDFEGGGGDGMTEQDCMRWQALKVYIREWARQEKDMVKVDRAGGNWGTGARRGSWAI
ncbi:hypothetical protein LTR36_002671 [Oleoguttula mirabilis]|uniref:Uncharacterized protein n=1 Tax=Oleoguttula mirabilis TaxID=1507867 RepID=A0AAV9JKJ3_9PEZI|nr:hypothetical protein LTR36_002671 [Oleoguttula mirabilis]